MLDKALFFFADELNSYLQARTGLLGTKVKVSAIVNDDGKYVMDAESIAVTMLNIEEETIIKDHQRQHTYKSGQHMVLNPPLNLNLMVMFSAKFTLYDQALKYISHVLTFFQNNNSFSSSTHPALDRTLSKLNVELQRLSFDELNQVWAFIGGKQLPSVIYKVRMIAIQDQIQSDIQQPITVIDSSINVD
jgi:hypothetical protein